MQDALTRAALAAVTLMLTACATEDADPDREAYDIAIADDAYKSWPRFPNAAPDLYPSGQHNGDYVRSYMNDVAAASLSSFSGEFPDGSILVKEQYADPEGKTLNGHTVMYKREGYDPEHGDWYWIAFNPSGGTTTHNGMAEYCYGCHTAAKTNDWVYTPFK